jgi:hypothetical protein
MNDFGNEESESGEQQAAVTLLLTGGERIEFQKQAERCGLSLAAWMLDRLREAARREAKEA